MPEELKPFMPIIYRLYINYGEKCIEKLNGMFAFAIYDKNEKTFKIDINIR